MKPPDPNNSGDPRKKVAASMIPSKARPDALADLSIWLQSQWLRHYVMFSALGSETDGKQMARIGTFIDGLKGVRK